MDAAVPKGRQGKWSAYAQARGACLDQFYPIKDKGLKQNEEIVIISYIVYIRYIVYIGEREEL